ncbi:MAG TPA: TIR domain-containing protein [Sphingomicrobium sp.]|nr:TIR domain-containing protein [Sphingomicrobium sp.]
MSEVFLSYARDDEAVARRVAKALEAAGFIVWWDAHLPAHRAYSEVIEKRLTEAKAVVVLWSESGARSQWVRAEADFARSAGKLVQAQLDGGLPPMPFNQIQSADLKGWRGSNKHPGWSKLQNSVAALIKGEELTAPADPAPVKWWAEPRGRWLMAAGALLLFVAAALIPLLIGGGETKRPRVAVLPFESLDSRDESLVAGIWEDTRQAIGRNPQLLVLGPNTAEEIAEKGTAAAGKVADFLVEASVRSTGDRIRVSANLVRTEDGSELWSKNFDRRLDDVFALQSEIAGEIEGHVRGRLAERGGTQPQNIATSGEVYALYSDARAKIRKRQARGYQEAHKQLEQVVRLDPNFAPGWATLAVVKGFGIKGPSPGEADARRAIALAPNLAAGHAALGFTLQSGPAAQAALHRALSLDPNDIEALHWLANSLDPATHAQEKLRLYSEVVEREPLWWPAILNKLELLYRIGNVAAVEQELARVEELGDRILSALIKSQLLARRGDLSGAVNAALPAYRNASADERELLANGLFGPFLQLGLFEAADKVVPPPSPWVPFIRRNDPKVLDMVEAAMPPEKFWTFGALPQVTGRIYFLSNQGERLAKRYRAVASTPEQFEALVGFQFSDLAPVAARALRSVGDEAQARRLLELAEAAASKEPAPDGDQQVRLARIYAVQGRTDAAIGLLSTAVRRGWLPNYLPLHTDIGIDPALTELKKDPRFEPLRQQILGHLAKERAELGPVSIN